MKLPKDFRRSVTAFSLGAILFKVLPDMIAQGSILSAVLTGGLCVFSVFVLFREGNTV
jgi:hypothetical protein